MRRSGFTLVELLVSVTILVVLATITVAALKIANAPSPAEEARSLASYLEGARDRAIHGREKWGVRLNLDPYGPKNSAGNPITVTSVSYVRQAADIQLVASVVDDTSTPEINYRKLVFWSTGDDKYPGVAGVDDDSINGTDDLGELGSQGSDDEYYGGNISTAYDSGILDDRGVAMTMTVNGHRLRYVAEYRNGDWLLNKDWSETSLRNRTDISITAETSFPTVAGEQPDRQFSRGICIDLDTSRVAGRIPSHWYDDVKESYVDHLDIMFQPNGDTATSASGALSMSLITCQTSDVEKTVRTPVFYRMDSRPNRTAERIVYISRGGAVGSSEISFEDTNGNSIPDDPFLFAETGR